MKFEISREALLRPLQQVTGVVERRQTLPVLANVLVAVDDEQISLTGTDLEVELIASAPLESGGEPGQTTIPARKLADIWRSLPDESLIRVEQEGDRVTVKSGRSRFQLATLPASEFPTIERSASDIVFTLPAEEFRRLLDRTSFSMAQQDVRYFLNGMLLEVTTDHVRTVATDGHRLAMCTRDGGVAGVDRHHAIIPRKGVLELAHLLGDDADELELTLAANYLRAGVGPYTLTTKLVDGKFPDYDKVIPPAGESELVGARETLRQAFARAAILSNEKYRGIRLILEPEQLTIQANNPEQEEAEEVVPVDYEGESLELGFNVSYLQDVLGALSTDSVRLSVADANSAALIEESDGGDSVYVVMPMRL
ncbi:MAG: DNA polymerase III subunit beta [Gammaproteobacteria bacterium]